MYVHENVLAGKLLVINNYKLINKYNQLIVVGVVILLVYLCKRPEHVVCFHSRNNTLFDIINGFRISFAFEFWKTKNNRSTL